MTDDVLRLWRDVATLATGGATAQEIVDRFAEGAHAHGLPLRRVFVTVEALHPMLRAQAYLWTADAGPAEVVGFGRGVRRDDDYAVWQRSPLFALVESPETILRFRLGAGEGIDQFPVLAELRATGLTDYVALKAPFADVGAGQGVVSAWATDRPGGFSDGEIDLLREWVPVLELGIKAATLSWTSATLLTTYLGADAAARVLAGEVDRGVARPLDAIIWSSDLVGFTRLSEASPPGDVIDLLNAYAEVTVAAVEEAGGQVLKLIGDGLLATFDVTKIEDAGACALAAAERALTATRALRAERAAAGRPTSALRLALHRGEVSYGNVGSSARLDFTVIGPAVNEAARLCEMCKALDQSLILSSAFHAAAPTLHHRLVGLGRYALRGVARPQALYTLDPGG